VRAKLEQLGISDVEIAPGKSGQFDVTVDGKVAYSRAQTGRFPTDEEIDALGGR
jgi:selT/selW/selH-like putative selenoprotein